VLYSRFAPLIAATTALSCTPYDPDLGLEPFLCGSTEPRCPDGYSCVERVGAEKVCLRNDVVYDAGGDGNLQCSGDTLEPNETIDDPTVVPIPAMGETHTVMAVVCPVADQDLYQLNVDSTGMNVRVEVNYLSSLGQLDVDLLNSTGIEIRPGTPTNGDLDKVRADFLNLAAGTYYGRVQGMGMLNNYEVTFIVTGNALPP
jgi:hypothetical protein